MPLILALPSKGRLQTGAVDWFARRGIVIDRAGTGREYRAGVRGLPGLDIAMLPAGEITRELAAGRIHLGVTGEDMIRERIPGGETRVRSLARLDFGAADLAVAVPDFWLDVETMADLDAVADDFRLRHGAALRVATKYHNLTRAFFKRRGIADYRLIDSQGATEAGPANGTCEAISDITSTGATLKANRLRILDDGVILHSTVNLWQSLDAERDARTDAVFDRLRGLIDAR